MWVTPRIYGSGQLGILARQNESVRVTARFRDQRSVRPNQAALQSGHIKPVLNTAEIAYLTRRRDQLGE